VIRLTFALIEVRAVAGHAVAAARHKKSFLEQQSPAWAKPALWFVGDEGLYLMSNGLPAQPDPADPDRLLVAYARGFRTAADKHAVDEVIGGDDFVEVIPLLGPQPGGPSLFTQLIRGAAAGATDLVIDVYRSRLELYLAGGASRF
jgi:Protein of unknown function (DUF3085)